MTYLIILGYALLPIVILYFGILIYLTFGHMRDQRAAVKDFMTAWENEEYNVSNKNNYTNDEQMFRIEFPAGLDRRWLSVDAHGILNDKIKWVNSTGESKRPSRWLRRRIQAYTAQIITMHKLQSELND